MPTCWNGDLGINNDHKDHMAYTVDGSVAGACPTGYDKRLPQVQLFVRIENYKGATLDYTLADESNVFHVDFMNGWQEGTLQNIIDNCPIEGNGENGYNPPCNCDQFLTTNTNVAGPVCDSDVRTLILDEPTDVVSVLPRGTCQGPDLTPKSWIQDPPLICTQQPPFPIVRDDDEPCNNCEEEEEEDEDEDEEEEQFDDEEEEEQFDDEEEEEQFDDEEEEEEFDDEEEDEQFDDEEEDEEFDDEEEDEQFDDEDEEFDNEEEDEQFDDEEEEEQFDDEEEEEQFDDEDEEFDDEEEEEQFDDEEEEEEEDFDDEDEEFDDEEEDRRYLRGMNSQICLIQCKGQLFKSKQSQIL